jgi:nicotinamidase-related amidase
MKTALILVDIQNDYFANGRMELVGMDAAGEKAGQLLTFFRDNRWPTFHIQHISNYEGATFFLPDTKGAEIHSGVKPRPDDPVIQKHYPNSFRETPLLDGFGCTVVHDACATRNLDFGKKKILAQDVQASFMAALGSAYAKVLDYIEFSSKTKTDE